MADRSCDRSSSEGTGQFMTAAILATISLSTGHSSPFVLAGVLYFTGLVGPRGVVFLLVICLIFIGLTRWMYAGPEPWDED